jgi:alpha-glucosidase
MPMACGFGLSGQPFVGADIGGFQGDTNPELFLRWMQMGVLTPFCRNHSETNNIDQYPWSFGPEIHDLAREAVRLRYRLMPYIYSAFVRATETGEPVQRPLVLDHQYDPNVVDLDDQYLFGRDLLVAPVTEQGQTSRTVYLPEGDWYDWHTGELHPGGQRITVETPFERIPLFARAGAAIPMWAEAPMSTDGYRPESVELHVFDPVVDGRWESVLVEDDGLTVAGGESAGDAERLTTTVVVERAAGEVTVAHETAGPGYAGHARTRFDVVRHS